MIIISGELSFNSKFGARSVLEFGARGNGVFDDTASFQAALSSGENTIYVPRTPAKYMISRELLVPSNLAIVHDTLSTLFRISGSLSPGECTFYRNEDFINGNSNIFIKGGVFDGNAQNLNRVDISGYVGGVGFRFKKISNLTIDGTRIVNPRTFSFQLGDTKNSRFTDIDIVVTYPIGNQDGLHFNGPADDIYIENLSGNPNDDLIALNADDEGDYQMTFGKISRVRISGVQHNNGAHSIRLLSSASKIEDVVIEKCTGTISGRLCEISSAGVPGGNGNVSNITIRDYSVTSSSSSGAASVIISCDVNGLTLDNFSRSSSVTTQTGGLVSQNTQNPIKNLSVINTNWETPLGVSGALVNAKKIIDLKIQNCSMRHEDSDVPLGSLISLTGVGSSIESAILDNVYARNLRFPIYMADSSIDSLVISGNTWKGWECGIQIFNSSLQNLVIGSSHFNGNSVQGNFAFVSAYNSSSISSVNFSSLNLSNTTWFVVYGGTATPTHQRYTLGQVSFSSVTNKNVNKNGLNIGMSLNGLSTLQDRTLLTPQTGDIINDVNDGIRRWSGSAWVNP